MDHISGYGGVGWWHPSRTIVVSFFVISFSRPSRTMYWAHASQFPCPLRVSSVSSCEQGPAPLGWKGSEPMYVDPSRRRDPRAGPKPAVKVVAMLEMGAGISAQVALYPSEPCHQMGSKCAPSPITANTRSSTGPGILRRIDLSHSIRLPFSVQVLMWARLIWPVSEIQKLLVITNRTAADGASSWALRLGLPCCEARSVEVVSASRAAELRVTDRERLCADHAVRRFGIHRADSPGCEISRRP